MCLHLFGRSGRAVCVSAQERLNRYGFVSVVWVHYFDSRDFVDHDSQIVIIICPPNRVAVISGRSRVLSDGRRVGFRILKGGRTIHIPIIEKVSWMDLNTIPLEVSVTNAYSRGTIPLNVQGIANVKVSSKEGVLKNAAERFLDVPKESIGQIAKETLEANLCGVLATLSPEEVNEDR